MASGDKYPHADRLGLQALPLGKTRMLPPKPFGAARGEGRQGCPVDVEWVQQDHGALSLMAANLGGGRRSKTLEERTHSVGFARSALPYLKDHEIVGPVEVERLTVSFLCQSTSKDQRLPLVAP